MLCVLSSSVSLLLLSDVIVALTEWSLPVLLVKVWVIRLVKRAGSRSRVPVVDPLRNVIVLVSLDADAHTESLEPVLSCLASLAQKFVHHSDK